MRILFLHPSLQASAGLAGFVIPWTSVKWLIRFFSALTLLYPLCLSGWTPVLCVCQCFSPSLFLSRYKKLTRTLMASVHVLMVTDDLAHSWSLFNLHSVHVLSCEHYAKLTMLLTLWWHLGVHELTHTLLAHKQWNYGSDFCPSILEVLFRCLLPWLQISANWSG